MAGSKRHFTYTLVPESGDVEQAARQARKVLGWACESDSRITCHEVTGDALGVVTLNLTIQGRDQWACRQLAQDILNYVTWGLQNPSELQLQSKRLPPHTVRGYSGGRTKTWRERARGEEDARS